MCASRTDCEYFRAAPRQQNRLFADLSDEHSTIRQIALRNSGYQVGFIPGYVRHMDLLGILIGHAKLEGDRVMQSLQGDNDIAGNTPPAVHRGICASACHR
jgi:hypothetical protein